MGGSSSVRHNKKSARGHAVAPELTLRDVAGLDRIEQHRVLFAALLAFRFVRKVRAGAHPSQLFGLMPKKGLRKRE